MSIVLISIRCGDNCLEITNYKNAVHAFKVAQLIGSKTVLNEFIAYQQMQGMLIRGELHVSELLKKRNTNNSLKIRTKVFKQLENSVRDCT